MEIQNLKMENAKLTKDKRAYKEEHAQNKQLQATIKQQQKEIAALKDEIKSLKDTNDFLSDQVRKNKKLKLKTIYKIWILFYKKVNNLNKQIYELNNKENDSGSNKPTSSDSGSNRPPSATILQQGLITSLSRKLYGGAIDTGVEGSPRPQDPNRSTHLADFDINTSSLKPIPTVDQESKAPTITTTTATAASATPSHLNRSVLPPETPSSSLRQRNCAQQ